MYQSLKLVWLSAELRDVMVAEARRMAPLETGGALMGYFSRGGSELVITDVIGPGPNATHNPMSFAPDLAFQHREISKKYLNSNRIHTYIADWHTHPGGALSPSFKDKRSLVKVAQCAEARLASPTMLLLAGSDFFWELAAFQLIPARLPGFGRLRRVETNIFGEVPQRRGPGSVAWQKFDLKARQ